MARSTKTPSRSPPSSQDRGHFAQIPLLLLKDKREGITSYTLAVYAAVQSFCTFGTNTDGYPSTEQLAERAGCSVRQVKRERSRLYMLGYLSWSRSSRRLRYTYKVHPDGDGPGLEVPNRPLEEGSRCPTGPSRRA